MSARLRVVIQCRLSSSRLPAKALLPIAGMPSVVLCWRRAANTGLDVRIATSVDRTDDELVSVLQGHRIPVIRGSLDDVRARYLQAAADMADDDLMVRLTADNVFPDGAFVGELVAFAKRAGCEYCAPFFPASGLPYGMSAEIFTVGALRRAAAEHDHPEDREHVTPALKKLADSSGGFRPEGWTRDAAHLRCTLDTFDDYERLLRVFRGVSDPVAIGWRRLVDRLASLDDAPRFRIPSRVRKGRLHGVMALGTAQLGLERYGAANRSGRPDRSVAVSMIREAVWHGVTDLDCARAYGEAESRVGEALAGLPREFVRALTKLDPLAGLDETASAAEVSARVEASVLRSCRELRTPALEVLMLHRWAHRTSHGGRIWAALKSLQADGCIRRLGASVYTPTEAAAALADPEITHLQLPFNVLDRRWLDAGIPELARRRPEVTIHARSAFLQGILVAGPEVWPDIPGVDPAAWIARLDHAAQELGRTDRADLCFAYVAAQDWIDAIVVGAETPEQLRQNLERCRRPPLNATECRRVEELLSGAPERLLDPSKWKMTR